MSYNSPLYSLKETVTHAELSLTSSIQSHPILKPLLAVLYALGDQEPPLGVRGNVEEPGKEQGPPTPFSLPLHREHYASGTTRSQNI